MVELSLMTSSIVPGIVMQQDRSLFRATEDWLPSIRQHSNREEAALPNSLNLKGLQLEESWSPVMGFSDSSKLISMETSVTRPVLIDIHESLSSSVLLGYDWAAGNSTMREEIMQLLTSRSNEVEDNMLNPIVLSDLMGSQILPSDFQRNSTTQFDYISSQCETDDESRSSFIYPTGLFHPKKPLLDFVGDIPLESELVLGQDGHVLFTGTGAEMKDLLSFVAEFYVAKNHTSLRKKQSVVPYFRRRASKTARGTATAKISTVKSPEKVNLRPSLSKSNNKGTRGTTLPKKDYFRACEILLSLMMNNKREDKTTIRLLNKSGPELPELLTQCAASIAGTGVAILFSVFCKLVFAKVPMCGSKVISSSLGIGFVWLSWTVNRLKKAIVQASKNPSKATNDDEDLMQRVDKHVKEILISAAMLMALALLRPA